MTQNGYIKLHRSILNWEWYGDDVTTLLFLHLLLTVNIKDSQWKGVDVPRGSRVCSLSILSEETGHSIKQIRGSLDKLKRTHSVAISKYPKFSIISIENWSKFQGEGTQQGTERAGKRAVEGHATGQQKKNKELKNKELKNNNITPKTEVSALILDFSDELQIQNLLFKWLDIRKRKRLPPDEDVIRLNLEHIAPMAEKSGMSVREYLAEVIRRSWGTFYEIPKKAETKNPKQETKPEASYDLEKFKEQSLHGELKYERRNKNDQS